MAVYHSFNIACQGYFVCDTYNKGPIALFTHDLFRIFENEQLDTIIPAGVCFWNCDDMPTGVIN